MKKNVFISAILLLAFNCVIKAQTNLVSNPSFEDTVECPVLGWIEDATGWFSANDYSPDFFHNCVPPNASGSFNVPQTYYGFQNARSGYGFAGIITFFNGGMNNREYIETELATPLIAGKKYYTVFSVALCDSSNLAANDIGAYFSDTLISVANNLSVLSFSPQVQNNNINNTLQSKNQWISVADSFIAHGGEKYIIIGNFKNDANTDTVFVGGGQTPYTYYFIDDVRVDTVFNNITDLFESAKNNIVSVFPNPCYNEINIRTENIRVISLSLTNTIGEVLIYKNLEKDYSSLIKLDVSILDKGYYFINFKTQNKSAPKTISIIKN